MHSPEITEFPSKNSDAQPENTGKYQKKIAPPRGNSQQHLGCSPAHATSKELPRAPKPEAVQPATNALGASQMNHGMHTQQDDNKRRGTPATSRQLGPLPLRRRSPPQQEKPPPPNPSRYQRPHCSALEVRRVAIMQLLHSLREMPCAMSQMQLRATNSNKASPPRFSGRPC